MGPEDEEYTDIFSMLQDRSFIFRDNRKSPEPKLSMDVTDLNSVSMEQATAQTLERKQTIIQIQTEFESRIQELRGACYSTEVRDSGVLVCGIHHSLWEENSDTCANLQQELTAVAQAASAALLSSSVRTSRSGLHRVAAQESAAQERLRLLDIAMNEVSP